jgi:YjjG family noncanonical pyrimidine nucleotidase
MVVQMKKNKSHIFFDLDHTLWDYNRNCEEALVEIYNTFNIKHLGIENTTDFIDSFHSHNDRLWDLYDSRKIPVEELRHRRFRDVFQQFGISDFSICDALSDAYLEISPNKPHLFDNAIEVLDYLQAKYTLHIITNGFAAMQAKKLNASGITHYFDTVTCSQKANARKPEKEIFEYAIKVAQATVNQSVMIGDNYNVDILGAQNIGMDYIYFNPTDIILPHPEKSMIKELLELKQFL